MCIRDREQVHQWVLELGEEPAPQWDRRLGPQLVGAVPLKAALGLLPGESGGGVDTELSGDVRGIAQPGLQSDRPRGDGHGPTLRAPGPAHTGYRRRPPFHPSVNGAPTANASNKVQFMAKTLYVRS